MINDDRKVSELGEYDLVERFRQRIGEPDAGEVWSGDDAAIVSVGSDSVVFTTDSMVEGVDFDLAYCDPEDVGFKAVVVNVSDVAAMGGSPGPAVATLGLAPDTSIATVDGVLEGMLEAAARWSVRIVGGDVTRASELFIGIALLGAPPPTGAVTRSGARAGDAIGVTGQPGLSGVGLALLRSSGREARDSDAARAHLRPTPRVEQGAMLAELGASAMIDISDGLAIDLYRLCSASDVGCDVGTGDLVAAIEHHVPRGLPARDAVLLGGEDFELLFAIAGDRFEDVRRALQENGTRCTRLGSVIDEGMIVDGGSLEDWKDRSWDHLLSR